MKVELIYSRDCPNVAAARENLSQALLSVSLAPSWSEWDQTSPQAPAYVRHFGSPTVLINGRDIAGVEPGNEEPCCRLYESDENGNSGVPSVALIATGLLRSASSQKHHVAKQNLFALPGILFSVLPFGACPACWPVYGGVLSALGLRFLLSSRYLLPFTAVFLLITLFTLVYRARDRHGYGPFAAGLAAGVLILYGKFSLGSTALAYSGVTVLIGSSLWNSWPRKTAATHCPKCAPSDAELVQLSAPEKSL